MANNGEESVTPTKPLHAVLADRLQAFGLSQSGEPTTRYGGNEYGGEKSEEDLSASISSLGLTEDDDEENDLERLMLWRGKTGGPLDLKSYRQVLTFDFAGRIRAPSQEYLNPFDRAILQQIGDSKHFSELPVGCMVQSNSFGSTFAVSPYLKTVSCLQLHAPGGKFYQWHLSAAHNSSSHKESVQPGVWSDTLMSGFNITPASGMSYRIVVHGEEDREKYNLADKDVRSPPASLEKHKKLDYARRYKEPSMGKVFKTYVDMMLILVEVDPTLTRPGSAERFFVPSGMHSKELDEPEPIYISGTPGMVNEENVPVCLGQPIPIKARPALALAINQHLLNPNIRGISFGHKIVTNGRQDKHSASSWKGMSGCPEGNMDHRGCFEGVHISGNTQVKDFVYNRAVSKDDPFLVCTYVDKVLPDLAGFTNWSYGGQEASLKAWLQNHMALLQDKGLWATVQAAGYAQFYESDKTQVP